MRALLLLAVLSGLVGCTPPRQLAGYVVADPDGMSERMAMLCYWGLHDCADEVAVPESLQPTAATRDDLPARGKVSDDTPTVEQ